MSEALLAGADKGRERHPGHLILTRNVSTDSIPGHGEQPTRNRSLAPTPLLGLGEDLIPGHGILAGRGASNSSGVDTGKQPE